MSITPTSLKRFWKTMLRVRRSLPASHDLAHAGQGLAAAGLEVLRHVLGEAADPHVGDGEPGPAAGLEQLVDVLPGAEHHEVRGDGPEVDHVRGDATMWSMIRENSERITRMASARGGAGHAEQLLHRERPAVPVHEGRAVVEAVGVGDDLPVGPLLRHLLEVAVHVADLGLGVPDRLPVEERLHAEGAVHGRVRGADVDRAGPRSPPAPRAASPSATSARGASPWGSPCAAGGRRTSSWVRRRVRLGWPSKTMP